MHSDILHLIPSRRASPLIGRYSFYCPTEGRRLSRPWGERVRAGDGRDVAWLTGCRDVCRWSRVVAEGEAEIHQSPSDTMVLRLVTVVQRYRAELNEPVERHFADVSTRRQLLYVHTQTGSQARHDCEDLYRLQPSLLPVTLRNHHHHHTTFVVRLN